MSEIFAFCPICQLPLKAICISAELHVSQCIVICEDSNNEECSKGVHCLSTDVFHYRDFSHKLLAAYRSSADFVPPELQIKPSPKKRKTPVKALKRTSPRKSRTPSKSSEKNNTSNDGESDTDILIQTKRPRRNLKFNYDSQDSNSVQSLSKHSKPVSEKTLHSVSSEIYNNKSVDQVRASQENYENIINKSEVTSAQEGTHLSGRIFEHKLSVVNTDLSADEEVKLAESRPQSPVSSINVSTTATNNVKDTDLKSKTTPKCNKKNIKSATKHMFKELISTPKKNKSNDNVFRLNCNSEDSIIPTNAPTSSNDGANHKTNVDFDDVIPGSKLNKEVFKNRESTTLSPAVTLYRCNEYNRTTTYVSSVTEDSVLEDEESVVLSDPPSSPEVVIPPKSFKKCASFLTSSSDSDLPLVYLINNKPSVELDNRGNEIKSKARARKPIQGRNTDNKIKGKIKAGKILRTPKKTPIYLNDSYIKSVLARNEVNINSEKDSDSVKSSTSIDAAFVPSTSNSSSQQSDSAFSAESTDRLKSSTTSSIYTSTEDTTQETRSSDPSYSESDVNVVMKSKVKSRNSPKDNERRLPLLPKRSKHSAKTVFLHSESSSSEIAIKEKIYFGGKKSFPTTVKYSKNFKNSSVQTLHRSTDIDDKAEWQSLLSKMRNGCYPSDLKIDSEDSLTVASSCSSSDTSHHSSTMLPPRQCPFYKKIPDTPFAVDAFQYWNIPGVKIYFLSHFHSDHYIGLKKTFSQPIYCTQITANLVRLKLRVAEQWLRILELNKPQVICGVEVTALDANHCPGSIMLLFALTNGRTYLHVGDFRASKSMTMCPSLQRISVSTLFLDTTYCNPRYCFPTQEEVIRKVIEVVRDQVKSYPHTLIVCGSYTIGKEKVFLGIAEAFDWHVWVRPEKQRVFACLNDARINSRLVKDPRSANVHVLPMASIQIKSLEQHLQSCSGAFTHVVGVKPTGWELDIKSHNFKVSTRDNITVYGVPYSEHSSFSELRDFVQFLQPHEVVPTVNVSNTTSRGKMNKYFSEWLKPQLHATETQTKVSQYFQLSGS